MDFENSQTKKNLETAFAGESQAHTKYRYYASKAKKDGYVQISNIFAETAGNESEHAKLWFKYLHDGAVPGTLDNLRSGVGSSRARYRKADKKFACRPLWGGTFLWGPVGAVTLLRGYTG